MTTRRLCIEAIPLTIRLLGDLLITVVDPRHEGTDGGPVLRTRLGQALECSCPGWLDTAACGHAVDARAVIVDTARALRVARSWPDTHGDDPLPAEIRRAIAVASVLVQPGARLERGLMPGHLRRDVADGYIDGVDLDVCVPS